MLRTFVTLMSIRMTPGLLNTDGARSSLPNCISRTLRAPFCVCFSGVDSDSGFLSLYAQRRRTVSVYSREKEFRFGLNFHNLQKLANLHRHKSIVCVENERSYEWHSRLPTIVRSRRDDQFPESRSSTMDRVDPEEETIIFVIKLYRYLRFSVCVNPNNDNVSTGHSARRCKSQPDPTFCCNLHLKCDCVIAIDTARMPIKMIFIKCIHYCFVRKIVIENRDNHYEFNIIMKHLRYCADAMTNICDVMNSKSIVTTRCICRNRMKKATKEMLR